MKSKLISNNDFEGKPEALKGHYFPLLKRETKNQQKKWTNAKTRLSILNLGQSLIKIFC